MVKELQSHVRVPAKLRYYALRRTETAGVFLSNPHPNYDLGLDWG